MTEFNLPSSSEIKYFIELSETLNMSRAAERLGVTQPTLSLALKNLEATVGVSLFVRSKVGMQLTKAGVLFQTQCRELLEVWAQLKRKTRDREEKVGGLYKLGCHVSVGLYTLKYFLPDLLKSHPALEIRLDHDLSRKITEKIISHELDFGIVVNPIRHPELVIVELGRDQVAFYSKKGAVESVLFCDPELRQTLQILNKTKDLAKLFPRQVHSGSLEIIADLVDSGAGVGILPGRVVAESCGTGVGLFDKSLPVFEDQICLVYRPETVKTRAGKEIAQVIKEDLKSKVFKS